MPVRKLEWVGTGGAPSIPNVPSDDGDSITTFSQYFGRALQGFSRVSRRFSDAKPRNRHVTSCQHSTQRLGGTMLVPEAVRQQSGAGGPQSAPQAPIPPPSHTGVGVQGLRGGKNVCERVCMRVSMRLVCECANLASQDGPCPLCAGKCARGHAAAWTALAQAAPRLSGRDPACDTQRPATHCHIRHQVSTKVQVLQTT